MSKYDISGSWDGAFRYPADKGPQTPFVATLRDDGGVISGDTIEPGIRPGDGHFRAIIVGLRTGTTIDFTKTYDGAGRMSHSVDYSGRLSEDGTTITGVWSLGTMDGTFDMVRGIPGLEEERARFESVGEEVTSDA